MIRAFQQFSRLEASEHRTSEAAFLQSGGFSVATFVVGWLWIWPWDVGPAKTR